jgi:superfamily I DNA and/or RNA helicase
MTNVKNAISMVKEGGHSQQCYASANATVRFATALIDKGMRQTDIIVLVFYKGQVDVVRAYAARAGIELRIETVDAFQGFDGSVILLDVVATAHQNKTVMGRPKEEESFTDYTIMQTITNYVKSKYRQNVGMTRAKDGLVYFGHLEAFL